MPSSNVQHTTQITIHTYPHAEWDLQIMLDSKPTSPISATALLEAVEHGWERLGHDISDNEGDEGDREDKAADGEAKAADDQDGEDDSEEDLEAPIDAEVIRAATKPRNANYKNK